MEKCGVCGNGWNFDLCLFVSNKKFQKVLGTQVVGTSQVVELARQGCAGALLMNHAQKQTVARSDLPPRKGFVETLRAARSFRQWFELLWMN